MFLPLIYALVQLVCVPQSWYVEIDSKQFLILTRLNNNLESELSYALPQLHAIAGCDTRHTNLR